MGVRFLSDTLTSANRARSNGIERFIKLAPQSAVARATLPQSQAAYAELEQIRCDRAQVLMDADSALDHVFFPDSGVVSVVAVYSDGSVIEMATVGREGCSDVQAVLGAKRSSVQLIVQIPGTAAKMSRAAFTRALKSMPFFRSVMDAYVQPSSNSSWCR